jgi:hypothetical protein
VLDEMAIYDQQLRVPVRLAARTRSGRRRVAAALHGVRPADHDCRDLTARPLRDRRARLEDLVAGSELVFPVRRLAPDGLAAWQQVVESGYEGLVAKDEASAYEGGRTTRWLKVKQRDWTDAEDGWWRRISPTRS